MKTHLSFRAHDLEKSILFYRTLLQVEPVKRYEDYALFITENPGLELALDRDSRPVRVESAHYGVAVADPSAVDAAIARFQAAGLDLDIEREQTCCYAIQTKVWTTDPDGRRWEVYAVLEETEQRNAAHSTCCCEEIARTCCSGMADETAA